MFLAIIYAEFWSSVTSYLRKQQNFILTLKFREKHLGTFLILKNAWDIWPSITTIFTLLDLVTIFKITIHELTHPPENNSTYLLLHRQAEQAGYTYWAISLNFTLEEK